jgi:hypothetical protein
MDGAVNPATIAIWISIGTSLLPGFFSVLVAMRSREGAAANRDKAVSTLFGIAFLLILLYLIAAARIAVWGMAYVGLLKIALLLTAAFAVVGMLFGLMRATAGSTLSAPFGPPAGRNE